MLISYSPGRLPLSHHFKKIRHTARFHVHSVNIFMTERSIHLQIKSIDALARGLQVLKALEQEKSLNIHELQQVTGIARTTLLRILKTVAEAGLATRHPDNGRYSLQPASAQTSLQQQARQRLSELTNHARNTLERSVPWPVNIAVPDAVDMRILDSDSQCSLTPNYHALGYRPPVLLSAVGQVYLAWSPPAVREATIARALARGRLRKQVDVAALPGRLAQVREQGYALYDPAHTPLHSPARYGALAIPLMSGTTCVGSLSMVWIPAAVARQTAPIQHLPALQAAAAQMSQALTDAGFAWPSARPPRTAAP
jgi:IclR family mhp operon transcriptional activator